MIKHHRKKVILIFLTCLTSLLTACGGVAQNTTENTSGTAIQTKNTEPPSPSPSSSLSVSEQLDVILSHKDMWLKEDVRMVYDHELTYTDGPYYSLMDLDQDGYIEIIVTQEKNQPCPSFYEVTEDKTLKQWTAEGDLPQAEGIGIMEGISIFDPDKPDVFYDSSRGKYHYIVMDYVIMGHDETEASYLEMTPANDHITFKKIGTYTFDAHKDNECHYLNIKGEECNETELYNDYAGMVRKTIYYSRINISLKKGKKLTADDLTDTLWNKFLMRDNYQCEKEKDLTEDMEHQFFFLTATKKHCTRGTWADTDEIRYTATDLDNNQNVELIVENQTKNDYCIYEAYNKDEGKWDTKGKDLASFTKGADKITWQTCTLKEFMDLNGEFLVDLLRECWLKFS